MNTPGIGRRNWGWRVRAEALNPWVSSRLRGLCELYRRLPEPAAGPATAHEDHAPPPTLRS
jgi:4-alpha-glucanotransferase